MLFRSEREGLLSWHSLQRFLRSFFCSEWERYSVKYHCVQNRRSLAGRGYPLCCWFLTLEIRIPCWDCSMETAWSGTGEFPHTTGRATRPHSCSRACFYTAESRKNAVEGAILSSVVPRLEEVWCGAVKNCFGITPYIVTPAMDLRIAIDIDNPSEIGAVFFIIISPISSYFRRSWRSAPRSASSTSTTAPSSGKFQ